MKNTEDKKKRSTSGGKRGQAGAVALRQHNKGIVAKNKKKIADGLKKLKEQGIPLIVKELARNVGLSVSTLNRPPYSLQIDQHREDERAWLSPNTSHTIAELMSKLQKAEADLKLAEEKYMRLKKELNSFHRLFDPFLK